MTPRHRPEKQANPPTPPEQGPPPYPGWPAATGPYSDHVSTPPTWNDDPERADVAAAAAQLNQAADRLDRDPAWTPDAQFAYPEQMQLQPPPPPKKRRHVFRWVFLAVQALFLAWTVSGAVSGGGTPKACVGMVGQALKSCQDAGHAGTALGVGLIVVVWAAVDIVLALCWLVFRRRG